MSRESLSELFRGRIDKQELVGMTHTLVHCVLFTIGLIIRIEEPRITKGIGCLEGFSILHTPPEQPSCVTRRLGAEQAGTV